MSVPLLILILVAGLLLVVFGANYLVEGASAIARRAGISEFVIGLTIVGIGTSLPEMVVSFIGAIEGNSAVSVGNIVGSNIFNVLLILGVVGLICPIGITKDNIKKDIPINIGVTVLLILLGFNRDLFGLGENTLSRIDGLVFLALFALYLYFSFKNSPATQDSPSGPPPMKTVLAILAVLGGLAGLVFGGRTFMWAAENLAKALGMSDKFIAVTILAGGTSLPELAASVVAALKHKDQMALGNIIGSTVSNVLFILGGSALIHPLSLDAMSYIDMGVFLLSSLLLFTCAFAGKKNKLDRFDGTFFLLVFAAYMAWLVINL